MPYKLDHKYRGTALIIGNEEFKGQPKSKRDGCKKDVEMMKELFRRLDFHVEDFMNLSIAKMKEKIENASKDKKNEECDCFALVLSSHGAEQKYGDKKSGADVWRHGVLGGDCNILYVDEIMNYFTDDACTLDGKPKLFFIQACRSRHFDPSTSYPSSGDTYDAGHQVNVIPTDGKTSGEDGGQSANKGDTMDTEGGWLYDIDLSDTDDIYSQWEKDPDVWIPEDKANTSGSQPSQEDAAAEYSEEDAGGSRDSGQMPQSPFDIVPIKCPDDCLVMYPVVSGKTAFRNYLGSFLIQFLYKDKNLAMLLHGCNVLKYLTQVSRDMSNYEYTIDLDDISRNRQDAKDFFKKHLYGNMKYLSSKENQENVIKAIGDKHKKHLEGDPAIVEPYLQNLIGKLEEDEMKKMLRTILPFKMTACTVHRLKGEVCFLPKGKNTPMKKLLDKLLSKFFKLRL